MTLARLGSVLVQSFAEIPMALIVITFLILPMAVAFSMMSFNESSVAVAVVVGTVVVAAEFVGFSLAFCCRVLKCIGIRWIHASSLMVIKRLLERQE